MKDNQSQPARLSSKRLATVLIISVLVVQLIPAGLSVHIRQEQGQAEPQQPPDLLAEENIYNQALQTISSLREAPVIIKLTDRQGNPVTSEGVYYNQTSSDFLVGITGSQWALPGGNSQAKVNSTWDSWSNLSNITDVVELDWSEWGAVEPKPGNFTWKSADQQFSEVLTHSPEAHFIVMFDDLSGYGQPYYNATMPNWVPYNNLGNATAFEQFREDLYQYVYNVVLRYSGKVIYWVTENELNFPNVQEELGNSTNKAVQIDITVAQAIMAANKNAKVLLSDGTYYSSPTPYTFAQDVLDSGVKLAGISIEAYPGSQFVTPFFFKEYVRSLNSIGLPILVQETGYPSAPTLGENQNATFHYWPGWGGIFTQSIQADWLKFVFTFVLSDPDALGIIWPFGVNENVTPWQHFGLIDENGTIKQSYYAYQKFVSSINSSGFSITNSTGQVSFRGFAGNYSLHVSGSPNSFNFNVRQGFENQVIITTDNVSSESYEPLTNSTWSLPNGTLYGLVTDGYNYFTNEVPNYTLISALHPELITDYALSTPWWGQTWDYNIVETFPKSNYIGILGPNILGLNNYPSITSSTGAEVYLYNWTLSEWDANVSTIVKEYPDIHIWQVWLEPQWYQGGYLGSGYNTSIIAFHYFNMLKGAYEIIKSYNPNDIVIGLGGSGIYPEGSSTWNWAWNFTRGVWSLGAANYSDGIAIDFFPNTLLNESDGYGQSWSDVISSELGMYENLTSKQVWITATGLPSDGSQTPEIQAVYLNQTFTLLSSDPRVKAVIWFWDYGVYSKGNFGLLTIAPVAQQVPEPAYYVFKWFSNHSGSMLPVNKSLVTFVESGLPTGATWNVTFNGMKESSTTDSIVFSEPSGSYFFTVGTYQGYSASPNSGTMIVKGVSLSQSIAFSEVNYSRPSFYSMAHLYIFAAMATVLVVAASTVGVHRRQRKNKIKP
ncbi:MAG: hypothetical protein ACP5NO_07880 [Thermoplasmata archaeon]